MDFFSFYNQESIILKTLLQYIPLLCLCLICPTHEVAGFSVIDSLQHQLDSKLNSSGQETVEILTSLSWEYRRKSADSTLFYAQKALILSDQIAYKNGKASALKNIGIGYDIKGQTDSALHYMNAALEVSQQMQDNKLIARNLNNLGLAYHRQGMYEIALEYYIKSLEISELNKDPLLGVTLMNIGFLEQKGENYQEALEYYQRALEHAQKEQNQQKISSCLYNIGGIYSNLDKAEKALDYFKRAERIALKNEDKLLFVKILLSKGRLIKRTGKPTEAQSTFKKVMSLAEEVGDEQSLALALLESALIDYSKKQYSVALSKCEQALKITKNTKNKDTESQILKLKADTHAALQQFEAAFQTEKEYIQASNEVFNKEKVRKMRALQTSREIKEKSAQVALLTAQQAEKEALIKQKSAQLSIVILLVLLAVLTSVFLYTINKSQRNRNKKLEEAVAERTRDLEVINQQLRTSNEELERFAFITSHDLKEPLRNISSFTGLLQRKIRKIADDESMTYFDFIKRNTHQMHRLIEDVLEYSRIGKTEDNLHLIDLNEIIIGVRTQISRLIEEKNAEILSENLPVIEGVKAHLLMIFKNLIENAIKYNNSEKPSVEIRVKEVGQEYIFMIKDNGIGIEKEYHEHIFKMFKRLHNREAFSGTGLGLATVKKLCYRMNGEIWLESKPNVGTTFFLKLPATTVHKFKAPLKSKTLITVKQHSLQN